MTLEKTKAHSFGKNRCGFLEHGQTFCSLYTAVSLDHIFIATMGLDPIRHDPLGFGNMNMDWFLSGLDGLGYLLQVAVDGVDLFNCYGS